MANITRKWTKWIAGFDSHGAMADPEANRAFFKFLEHWKPEIRIAGGDQFDFSPLRKKADAHERRASMAEDVTAGKQWLEQLQPTHYLRGNHCERLWDLGKQGEGVVQDYAKLVVRDIERLIQKMGTQMFPYNKRHGVMRLGSLKVLHGYRCGVSAARMMANTYGSSMCGHLHQFQAQTIPGLEQRTGYVVGSLCRLDQDYNRAQEGALTHENGWSFGVVDLKSGLFTVNFARQLDGQWLLPTGLEVF
jgi:UDP-2,3-diacylglucosamine pyrophosphatase LpxH